MLCLGKVTELTVTGAKAPDALAGFVLGGDLEALKGLRNVALASKWLSSEDADLLARECHKLQLCHLLNKCSIRSLAIVSGGRGPVVTTVELSWTLLRIWLGTARLPQPFASLDQPARRNSEALWRSDLCPKA